MTCLIPNDRSIVVFVSDGAPNSFVLTAISRRKVSRPSLSTKVSVE